MSESELRESANEAMACAQVQYDKMTLLYAIGCESDTAGQYMPMLCSAMDVDYRQFVQFNPASQQLPF